MLAGPGSKGHIAQRQFAAFARSTRSMSSFRPQMSRIPVTGRTIGGRTAWKASVPSIAIPGARFNSTSTSTPPPATEQVTPEPAPSNEWDVSNISLADFPEQIGYLKDIGLDFGWGPSSMVEYLMEHIHIWGGLPWLGSIVAAGILLRAVQLPLFLRSADTSARLQNNQSIIAPMREKMADLSRAGKTMESQMVRAEMSQKMAELGIDYKRIFLPMFIQIPIGFACYRVINNMSSLPVPALAEEKFAWITDLTVHDPTYILPLACSAALFFTLKKGGDAGGAQANLASLRKAINWGMPALSFAFVCTFPAALQTYFLTTSLFALAQSYLINNNAFRRAFGIAIAETQDTSAVAAAKARKIRMLTAEMEETRAKLAEAAKETGMDHSRTLSWIDRAMNAVKTSTNNVQKETSEKIRELAGQGAKKNSDGSAAEQRLSDKDRKLAEDYEKRRREEDEWKREERNHARREAHMKELEKQREEAKSAIKKKNTR